MSDAPADYVGGMLNGIVGFELTITRLQGKWKMSQNQPEANRAGVVAGLRADGRPDLAAEIGAAEIGAAEIGAAEVAGEPGRTA